MTVWLSEQISGIISSVYSFIILFTLYLSGAIKGPRLMRLQLMFITVFVSIGRHCCDHFKPLAVRIAFFEGFIRGYYWSDIFGGTWHFDQIDKKDYLTAKLSNNSGKAVSLWETCGSRKANSNVILAPLLQDLYNAMPRLSRTWSFARHMSPSVVHTPEQCPLHLHFSVFIEGRHLHASAFFSLTLADFPARSADRGELPTAPIEDELCSVGNKCNVVIMRNGRHSSPDITLQSPHRVTSQFIFREFVGSGSLMWKALSATGIVAGLAARI